MTSQEREETKEERAARRDGVARDMQRVAGGLVEQMVQEQFASGKRTELRLANDDPNTDQDPPPTQ